MNIDRSKLKTIKCDGCDADHEVVSIDLPPMMLEFIMNTACRDSFLLALESGDADKAELALGVVLWLAEESGDDALADQFANMVNALSSSQGLLGRVMSLVQDHPDEVRAPAIDEKDLN